MLGLSSEALLAGLASGDAEATTAFVRRFQRRVFGLALTILHDRGAAEEVAQETFVRAWRHGATFDARKGEVGTWLLTIARNLAIDALRMRRADPVDPQVLLVDEAHDSDDAVHERVARDEEARRVLLVTRRLPPEQQRALLLAAFQGRSAREISEAEGIPIGTAKTRIRRALMKVRDELGVRDES